MELHENIRALRKARGWSQQQLAERVGYGDRSSIAKIEAGKVDLPRSKIAEFARVFDVTPAYLMGYSEETDALLVSIAEDNKSGRTAATAATIKRELLCCTIKPWSGMSLYP